MREQERTRNNFMDVVRLGALDEVCFGKGSAHRFPVVLRGRDGQPLWITRAGSGADCLWPVLLFTTQNFMPI